MKETTFLQMRGITKRFPGVTALDGVDFSCAKGEIHALVGENGAGKSTLMNILGGLLAPDEGGIEIDGVPVSIPSPQTAFELGIGFVHQESNLLLNLNVRENIFLSHERNRGWRGMDKKAMAAKIDEINARLGYELPAEAPTGSLKLADRQIVEIVRALLFQPRMLIMDEPTAMLSEDEVQRLFTILDTLRSDGVGVIYISHRLDEIISIADNVTVLKDGKNAGSLGAGEMGKDEMIQMMIGRTLTNIYPDRSNVRPGGELLRVEGLSIPGKVRNVSFSVRAGEILGFGGLEGQGQREVARAIFGDLPFTDGTISANGVNYGPRDRGIGKRIDGKLGYVTHDRHGEGLILHQPLRKNATLASLSKFKNAAGQISVGREKAAVEEQVDHLSIKTASIELPVSTLSGGNQQKVMLARWLIVAPKILIIDEPTRGVDVGARTSLYNNIDELTRQGVAVIILTSDMMELIGLSDRILVFYEGSCNVEIGRNEASEEVLMRAASGVGQEGGGS